MQQIDPNRSGSPFVNSEWTARLVAAIASVAVNTILLGGVLGLFELRSSEAATALARAAQPVAKVARDAADPADANRKRGV